MEYNFKRAFEHRTHGTIAENLQVKAEVQFIEVGGVQLPGKSVEYLLNFALQSLQDAYAGAKSGEEAVGLFDKKLKALQEGTIGVRVGGGQSERDRVIVQVTRAILKAKLTEEAFAQYKEDDDKVREAYDKNSAKIDPHVDAKLEELRKAREAKAKLGASIELDI